MLAPREQAQRPGLELDRRVGPLALHRARALLAVAAALTRGKMLDLLFRGRILVLTGGDRQWGTDARFLADLRFDLLRERGVLLKEVARVVLTLAQAIAVVDVPGARLLEHAQV